MVTLNRKENSSYESFLSFVDVKKVANKVKHFPKEWINEEGNHIKNEAFSYLSPLVSENPNRNLKNGLPEFFTFKK